MTGLWATSCERCETSVRLTEPTFAHLDAILDECSYHDRAAQRGTCPSCSQPASVVGPVVFVRDGEACTILALSSTARLSADLLIAILNDLLGLLPESCAGPLTIYATYEHFRLDQARPDLYHTVNLDEILSRHTDEEETYALDIANDLLRAGDPLGALEQCCRIVRYLPDLLHSPSWVENLQLIQATARIKGADEARLRSCKEFLDGCLDALKRSEAAAWKVPYAFGDDAPLLDGVPAGYAVPSAYLQREELAADELAVVYFLLLLFSSAFRRAEPNPSKWQLMRHSMLQLKVERHWGQASAQCHAHLIELYRQVSGGRSLTEDMSLDADE